MNIYVVSYINFFDNELKSVMVQSNDWKGALINSGFVDVETVQDLSHILEEAKKEAFDQDWLFNVLAIGIVEQEII